jgi:hypothetical protein
LADIFDDTFELNGVAFITEVSATLVSGIGGKKGGIGGQYLIGKETQEFYDLYEDMENLVVKLFSQSVLEIGECGFTG